MLHTVWGCKRPELLITETLAFHDRRTEDLNTEVVDSKKPGRATQSPPATKPGKTTDSGIKKDPSFNSRFRPQGSAFVELFNPWPQMAPQTSDLAPVGGYGVDLTKTTGPNRSGSPVWRLIVVDPTKTPQSAGKPTATSCPTRTTPRSPIGRASSGRRTSSPCRA